MSFQLFVFLGYIVVSNGIKCNYVGITGIGFPIGNCINTKRSDGDIDSVKYICDENKLEYHEFEDQSTCKGIPDNDNYNTDIGQYNDHSCNANFFDNIIGCNIAIINSYCDSINKFNNLALIIDECISFQINGTFYSRYVTCGGNKVTVETFLGLNNCGKIGDRISSGPITEALNIDCYTVTQCNIKSNWLGYTFGRWWLVAFIAACVLLLCYCIILCKCCCCKKKQNNNAVGVWDANNTNKAVFVHVQNQSVPEPTPIQQPVQGQAMVLQQPMQMQSMQMQSMQGQPMQAMQPMQPMQPNYGHSMNASQLSLNNGAPIVQMSPYNPNNNDNRLSTDAPPSNNPGYNANISAPPDNEQLIDNNENNEGGNAPPPYAPSTNDFGYH